MRHYIFSSVFVLAATVTSVGEAQVHDDWVYIGGGAKLGGHLSATTPPEPTLPVNPPIPPFLGGGYGGGLSVEALYGDFLGGELGFYQARVEGEGVFLFDNGQRVKQTLASREFHIPLLIKLQVPRWRVRPFLGLGVTLAYQSDTEYTVDGGTQSLTTLTPPPEPLNYSMLTSSAGATLVLDEWRIPVEFRWNYHAVGDSPNDRATYTYTPEQSGALLDSLSVAAEWENQFWFLVGVQYWGKFR